MYQVFVNGFPVLLSLWQSGLYQLYNARGLKPYLDAWAVVHETKDK